MQPSAGIASQKQNQYAWQLASVAILHGMDRFRVIHQSATRCPTVEMFIETNKSAQDYFDIIQKLNPQTKALHEKVCQCMIQLLKNEWLQTNPLPKPPVRNGLKLEDRSDYIKIINLIERKNEEEEISASSVIIQIEAIEAIFAALRSAKK
jgi:hypothetical protein